MIGTAGAEGVAQGGHRGDRQRRERRPAQAARFPRERRREVRRAGGGRIGGDHAVHGGLQDDGGDGAQARLVEIGRHLDDERHSAAGRLGERLAATVQRHEQGRRPGGLETAQPGGVRRRKVDRQIVRVRVQGRDPSMVVVGRPRDGRVAIDADVDPEDHRQRPFAQAFKPPAYGVEAAAVEPHAVDECAIRDRPEKPWLGVARLRARRHRAHLDEAESETGKPAHRHRVLVEPGGSPIRFRNGRPITRIGSPPCDGAARPHARTACSAIR